MRRRALLPMVSYPTGAIRRLPANTPAPALSVPHHEVERAAADTGLRPRDERRASRGGDLHVDDAGEALTEALQPGVMHSSIDRPVPSRRETTAAVRPRQTVAPP